MVTKIENKDTFEAFTLIFLQGTIVFISLNRSEKTQGLLSKNIELCCNIRCKK